ncbi:hypothetical protein RQM59_01215 [Flavobacteriaceae bacterium S356]|uniref:Uncharacterized protein n=1 Tax=Asprobacillus argus TaxID=3076534 RepID=A0ABU3LBA9_9FLAO|nr:hypothetical protein [Flavobacteriaceae bacterium S356]
MKLLFCYICILFMGIMPIADEGVSITSNMNGFNLIGNPYPLCIPASPKIQQQGFSKIKDKSSYSLIFLCTLENPYRTVFPYSIFVSPSND